MTIWRKTASPALLMLICLAFLFATSSLVSAARPVVIRTVPSSGDLEVDPSLTESVVEFDQPMRADGYSVLGGGLSFPEVTGAPYWIDSNTFALPVRLQPGTTYVMGFNSEVYTGFQNERSEPAVPYTLTFTTATEAVTLADEQQIESNRLAYDALRRAVLESYSYRDRLELDWEALFDAHRDSLLSASSNRAFAIQAAKLLSNAKDPHMWLVVDGNVVATYSRPAHVNVALPTLVKILGPGQIVQWSGGVISSRIGDVGYILIASWVDNPTTDPLKAIDALRSLSGLPALIIDVRVNSGGNEFLAQQFAGCFADTAVPYAQAAINDPADPKTGWFGKIVTRTLEPNTSGPAYRGKVFVLTGNGVMSSCEGFLLMMRATGATLVGDTSAGSSGNPQPYPLGNGVEVYVPSWQDMDMNGVVLEGRGIDPDVFVYTEPGDFAERDPVLEEALRLAKEAIKGLTDGDS
ncbi:MAG TPA: S41 family peptidase [Bacillota bacterium]|nr:S41 family peptidase [Bacillota bacterium]